MPKRLLCAGSLACLCVGLSGCKTVWPGGGATAAVAPAAVQPVAVASKPSDGHVGPYPELTEQQALQKVLPTLQRLAATDPDAHAQVLEQLAAAEPSLWPQTVERAESTLKFREQLAAKSQLPGDVRVASNQTPIGAIGAPNRPAARPATLPPPDAPNPAVRPAPTTPPTAYPVTQPDPLDGAAVITPRSLSLMDRAVTPASNQTSENLVGRAPQVIQNQHAHATIDELPDTQTVMRLASAATVNQLAPSREVSRHTDAARDWRAELDETIRTLAESSAALPRTTEEAHDHVRLRLLQLAAGDRDSAVAAPPGLSTTEQSYWSKQIYALAMLLDTERISDRGRRSAMAATHQADALAAIRELSPLQVRNANFCKEIYGYGAYEAHLDPHFQAGDHAELYVEVDNYRSDSTEDGYHTSLATSYRVLDQSGGIVDRGEFPLVEDHCLTRRRDFHITYGVTLPTAIYAGDYRLELTITDQLANKIGTETVPFSIVGK